MSIKISCELGASSQELRGRPSRNCYFHCLRLSGFPAEVGCHALGGACLPMHFLTYYTNCCKYNFAQILRITEFLQEGDLKPDLESVRSISPRTPSWVASQAHAVTYSEKAKSYEADRF